MTSSRHTSVLQAASVIRGSCKVAISIPSSSRRASRGCRVSRARTLWPIAGSPGGGPASLNKRRRAFQNDRRSQQVRTTHTVILIQTRRERWWNAPFCNLLIAIISEVEVRLISICTRARSAFPTCVVLTSRTQCSRFCWHRRYTAIAGATWAESIVRTLFGYQPSWTASGGSGGDGGGVKLWMPTTDRTIEATLSGLATPCGLVTITAGAEGVSASFSLT